VCDIDPKVKCCTFVVSYTYALPSCYLAQQFRLEIGIERFVGKAAQRQLDIAISY